MTRPTPTWRAAKAVSVLGAATMALAACGGGGNNTATSPQTPAPGAATASAATASSPSASARPTTGGGGAQADGTLTIGTLLPQTGSLAYLGPPEFAGVDLAVKDINAAGGVPART